jgi:hypothetical protein
VIPGVYPLASGSAGPTKGCHERIRHKEYLYVTLPGDEMEKSRNGVPKASGSCEGTQMDPSPLTYERWLRPHKEVTKVNKADTHPHWTLGIML